MSIVHVGCHRTYLRGQRVQNSHIWVTFNWISGIGWTLKLLLLLGAHWNFSKFRPTPTKIEKKTFISLFCVSGNLEHFIFFLFFLKKNNSLWSGTDQYTLVLDSQIRLHMSYVTLRGMSQVDVECHFKWLVTDDVTCHVKCHITCQVMSHYMSNQVIGQIRFIYPFTFGCHYSHLPLFTGKCTFMYQLK